MTKCTILANIIVDTACVEETEIYFCRNDPPKMFSLLRPMLANYLANNRVTFNYQTTFIRGEGGGGISCGKTDSAFLVATEKLSVHVITARIVDYIAGAV